METQHDILVQNKRDIQFKITINRKFTLIRGDSATGKSTLFQMVSDAGTSVQVGLHIACDVPVVALHETGYKYELSNVKRRTHRNSPFLNGSAGRQRFSLSLLIVLQHFAFPNS